MVSRIGKTFSILIAFLALFSMLHAEEIRTWTNAYGSTFEAKLINAGRKTITIENAEGKQATYEMRHLSQADIDYVNQWKEDQGQEAYTPKKPSIIVDALKGKLVQLQGRNVRRANEFNEDADYYVFYFSAHWCPPCRKFTPKLSSFYDKNKDNKSFELIFVSSDHDKAAMEEYIKWGRMNFPALDYGKISRARLITQYGGNGIPCLVVVDRDGKVLAHSYDGDRYLGPTSPLNKLKKLIAAK